MTRDEDTRTDPGNPSRSGPVDRIAWGDLPPTARLVDVRSPAEFAEDHVPGAVSVALLDNEERAVVGRLFRHTSPAAAREWALTRVEERLEEFRVQLREALELDRAPDDGGLRVVMCARGGQRSEAVTRLLVDGGDAVLQLEGGYRSYRQWVRDGLADARIPGPVVLNGLTGCGKTRLIRELARTVPRQIIDLEGIAGHRSSVFGDIGLDPVSQKCFESRLLADIRRLTGPWTLVEWEARRLGNREMPRQVYECLRAAPVIEVDTPLEVRVDLLCEEYLAAEGVSDIAGRLPSLARFDHVGAAGVERLESWLRAGHVRDVARWLLEHHYDPRYEHGSQGLDVVVRIPFDGVSATARRIHEWLDGERRS